MLSFIFTRVASTDTDQISLTAPCCSPTSSLTLLTADGVSVRAALVGNIVRLRFTARTVVEAAARSRGLSSISKND